MKKISGAHLCLSQTEKKHFAADVHLVCLFRGSSAIGLRSLHDLPLPLLRVKVHAQHLPKGLVRRAADEGEVNNILNTVEINFKCAEQGKDGPDIRIRTKIQCCGSSSGWIGIILRADPDPELYSFQSNLKQSSKFFQRILLKCSNTKNFENHDADEKDAAIKTHINLFWLVNITWEKE
jgi:hypothetical protein